MKPRKSLLTLAGNREKMREFERDKARYEAILLGIGDALVVTDPVGKVVFINKAFGEILGWKEGEVKGKLITDVLPSQDEYGRPIPLKDRAIFRALHSIKKVKSVTTQTHYYQNKNGGWVPVNITVAPVLLKGKLIGAIEIFRDITQDKAVDRVKTEFVSLASHELRTPLTTVKWYAEILLDGQGGDLSDSQRQYLQEINEANQQMIELVNYLLNMTRLELGTFVLQSSPTEVSKLFQEIIESLRSQLSAKEIKFRAKSGKMPLIMTDQNLLRIVVRNLLVNAIKYTPRKGNTRSSSNKS